VTLQPVGLPVDASVNVMVNGAEPEVGVPLNAATGAAADTLETQRLRRMAAVITQLRLPAFISNLPEQPHDIRKVYPFIPVEIERTHRLVCRDPLHLVEVEHDIGKVQPAVGV
jgi:hypothetical protein